MEKITSMNLVGRIMAELLKYKELYGSLPRKLVMNWNTYTLFRFAVDKQDLVEEVNGFPVSFLKIPLNVDSDMADDVVYLERN